MADPESEAFEKQLWNMANGLRRNAAITFVGDDEYYLGQAKESALRIATSLEKWALQLSYDRRNKRQEA